MACFKRFPRNEDGATAIEYAIILALIAGVVITVVALVRQDLLPGLTTISDQL